MRWSNRNGTTVDLTKKQIENSPDIDAEKPISRQHELRLSQYYTWPLYWTGVGMATMAAPSMPLVDIAEEEIEQAVETDEDEHLRSTKEVLDYHIRATDGDIGHVEDIIVGDASWVVRYFVVDTRNWLPEGKRYWCRRNGWITMPMNCEYEERFYDFYGRPKYWKSRKFGQL